MVVSWLISYREVPGGVSASWALDAGNTYVFIYTGRITAGQNLRESEWRRAQIVHFHQDNFFLNTNLHLLLRI